MMNPLREEMMSGIDFIPVTVSVSVIDFVTSLMEESQEMIHFADLGVERSYWVVLAELEKREEEAIGIGVSGSGRDNEKSN
ncbi:unnamed protein product [Microthlaspi erraticum]|uniref:Uncharacterized protein n=1 Tax=Microthlaspi erraticum TaxID=1685480 RepID=A0A6D2IV77_9BRAS|nr:unnamed protein product [Microthlaspi erraticum]